MSINWQEILFHFLGGLGLFLYSIKTMGDGLQQAAGDRLRFYIDKYTSNPFLGVLVGIVVTALIQSSTGVTVITVGLVSASLLTLRQAIGIIMGANIGTTVTSFIIGFKLGEVCFTPDFPWDHVPLLYKKQNSKQYRAHPVWCRGNLLRPQPHQCRYESS